MKFVTALALLFSLPCFAGPSVSGGPPAPQQQEAHAFVNIGGSPIDIDDCNNGDSAEAKAAMRLAMSRARKLSCIHGGSPGPVEPGQTYATETGNFGWLCMASAILPCR